MTTEETKPAPLYSHRSLHHDITVEQKDGVRVMRFGGRLQCAADAEALDQARTPAQDYLHLAAAFAPHAQRTLMIGLGGGVLARTFLRDYPRMSVDAVELDPAVVEVACTYFDLKEDPRLTIITDDGRHFLAGSDRQYDIIILDALFEAYTPFVFATTEYFEVLKPRLAPGGVYAHNAIGHLSGDESLLFRRYLRTMRDAFASMHVFGVSPVFNQETGRRNYVIVATDDLLSAEEARAVVLSRADGEVPLDRLPSFAEDLISPMMGLDEVPPLTDAEAPTDGLMRS
jgi:spermidine synthase